METQDPVIRTLRAYDRAARKLPLEQLHQVELAATKLPDVFGRPHLHSALGIRRFGRYWEFRAGLKLRVLFLVADGDFCLVFVGSHDQLADYVRNNG